MTSLFAVESCEICGPLEPPLVHSICHPHGRKRRGCGHPLDDHSSSLKCRICGRECGIDCTRVPR